MAYAPYKLHDIIRSGTNANGGTIVARTTPPAGTDGTGLWTQRYGEKHRMHRVTNWPLGITPPKKVRVYWRHDHWFLQWWEPAARKNIAERVDGDLIAAISRARDLDQRLLEYKRSGRIAGRIKHRELVEKFLKDLGARADAGEIEPRSIARYRSALVGHYLPFCESPPMAQKWPFAPAVNREFALGFAAFLRTRDVHPNGQGASKGRPMQSGQFVFNAARALFAWAANPDRGNLLAEGFRNPFLRNPAQRKKIRDLFGEPDITVPMAAQLLEACDDYQRRLFAPLIFYGLRAAEPAYLFGEYLDEQWLRVPCNPQIAYSTKGKRDKRLPIFEAMSNLIGPVQPGILFPRRSVTEAWEEPPLLGRSLAQLAEEFHRRVKELTDASAAQRQKIREEVLKEAGATSYDRIEGEFKAVARHLNWPAAATLKDLRHLFATAMAAAGLPEPYRQYLMGHATSSAAIGAYTHLNRIRDLYVAAIKQELQPLIDIITRPTIQTLPAGKIVTASQSTCQ